MGTHGTISASRMGVNDNNGKRFGAPFLERFGHTFWERFGAPFLERFGHPFWDSFNAIHEHKL